MSTSSPPTPRAGVLARADYGIDAPGVIRNLLLGAALSAAVAAACSTGLVRAPALRATAVVMAAVCLVEAGWMVWGSRVGKLRLRDRVLDALALRGGEAVLDVGCGRGLLLIGAARRLPEGRAVGVDLWQAKDLSGNAAERTLANARAEGVPDRVEVHTGDMRMMPFGDGGFDAAVSNLAIHNISGAEGREAAITEIARVVKAGGRVAIADFAGTALYARTLRRLGWSDVRRSGPSLLIFPPVRIVTARKPGVRGGSSAAPGEGSPSPRP